MSPMCIVVFRFANELPSREELIHHFKAELGSRARHIDTIEFEGNRVEILSQDLVALTYAKKICLRMGAVLIDPGSLLERASKLPAWVSTPWVEQSWLCKIRILFGSLRL